MESCEEDSQRRRRRRQSRDDLNHRRGRYSNSDIHHQIWMAQSERLFRHTDGQFGDKHGRIHRFRWLLIRPVIGSAILLSLLVVAALTDVRWGKIYNWTTYPGILIGLSLNGLASLLNQFEDSTIQGWLGAVGLQDSLLGLLVCGGMMVVCYLFFAGGIGGGDIKLLAMIGAFVGLYAGLESILWTFVLGGCMALISLVWRYGPLKIVTRVIRFAAHWLRLGGRFSLTDEDRQPLKTKLFLAPSALAAVIIVRFQLF